VAACRLQKAWGASVQRCGEGLGDMGRWGAWGMQAAENSSMSILGSRNFLRPQARQGEQG
jgi:hypothetical protein